MKKIIPFLALAVLISSCGNKMTLLKRHYTKGYYIQGNKHNQDVAVHKAANKVKAEKIQPTVTAFVSETKKPEQLASLSVKETVKGPVQKTYQAQLSKHIIRQADLSMNRAAAVSAKDQVKPVSHKAAASQSGDANAIVEAILCIFIPPLAVFLHEDSITSHFWIDLLLCFLFFLPGVIYAFIICFA